MKVLIVEDAAISRLILKKSVEKSGHECLVAEDGDKAWELYQNTPEVDVSISDWMMPGIDGLEFCRRIRELDSSWYTFSRLDLLQGDEHYARDRAAATLEARGVTRRMVRQLAKPGKRGERARSR